MDKLLEKVGEGPRFKATIMEALPKEHMHCQVQIVEFVELYVHRRLFYQDAQFIEIPLRCPSSCIRIFFKEYAKLNLGSMKVNLRHFISESLLLWIIKFESQRTYCPKPKAGSN